LKGTPGSTALGIPALVVAAAFGSRQEFLRVHNNSPLF